MQTPIARRLRNGKSPAKPKSAPWLAWAVGLIAAGVALAPWWAGSLYVGPRPVAPEDALMGLLWAAEFPLLGSALVGLLLTGGLVVCAWNIAMWRVPVMRFLFPLMGLIVWMGLSMTFGGSGWNGVLRVSNWMLALVAVVAIPAVVRRNLAAWMMVGVLTVSASLLGLRACVEYLQSALAGIPNWRVFGSFFNPNLLAGYFVMSAPFTMGVLLLVGRELRIERMRWLTALLTVGLWLQLSGLVLTASRLGLLSFLFAAGVFFGFALAWKLVSRDFLLRLGVVGILTVGLMWLSQPSAQRLTPQAASQDVHSGAFRIETWKGTWRMALANPILGVGTGNFEVHYPRYASVGYTRSAHSTYLELAGESGFPALILLILMGVGWLTRVLQSELPPPETPTRGRITDWRPLRVGVLAGVAGAVAHNAVDSDVQVLANLLMLACLLALGIALAPDGVFTYPVRPMERRATGLLFLVVLGLGVVSSGLGEWFANQARYYALISQIPQAVELYQRARLFDSRNPDYLMELGELYYALGRRETAFTMLEQAVRWKPTPRNLYRLGLYYERDGQPQRAREQFQQVLERDPNNLPALLKLAQMAQPDPNAPRLSDEALRYYQHIVAIEDSPYGRIRAVPEIVETAYGFAHLALARHYQSLGETERALRHYEAALSVFRAYRQQTYPFNRQGRLLGLYNPERERQILQAHLLTLQGYADLLEKAGKRADADALRQEYAKLISEE
ncbi:MAG: hypothetical protein KatS3mg021_0465 [Fimbriimonadales bacterium]|nr:MAG: hypothetical protein KatS3mg021_0465 [Fimbriimonadales bacterium]